jgi:hypothetical protein
VAPTLDERVLAQQYGFAYSVMESDPELANIFHKAVAETWEVPKIQAAVRNTKWYQSKQESWRNAQLLRAADPASYAASVAQVRTYMQRVAGEMGLDISGVQDVYAETAFQYGWDANQIQQNLSRFVKVTDGQLWGQIGQVADELRQRAFDQGITLDEGTIRGYAQRVAGGYAAAEDYTRKIDEMAASAFPHLADRLRAGETLADIASPYRQSMAALLEMNPDAVTTQDPTIRQALAAKDKDGKPVLQTLFDFENSVRKDQRWLKTKNAQDAGLSVTKRILNDMGVSRG